MKLTILKISLFIIIIIFFNIAYLKYLKEYDLEFNKTVEISKMKGRAFDCIVLGNSVVYDGIDTEYLTNQGLSSYNFALGGENLKSNYIQLNQYLVNNRKPKIVLLGLSPGESYDEYTGEPSIHPIIEYNYNLLNRHSIRSIPMIKFQWLAIEIIKKIISKDHRKAKVVMGQLRTTKTIPDNTNYNNKIKQTITIDEYKGAKYLLKIDSLCKKNKIILLAIGMPGYRETQNMASTGVHLLNFNNNQITYINLNSKDFCSSTFNPEKDWLGNSHLNMYGARKLTEYLYNNYLKRYNY